MIVKYKSNAILNDSSISTLAKTTSPSVEMKMIRVGASKANVVKVKIGGKKPSLAQMKSLAKKLSKRSDVEYAEPDYIMKPLMVPDDTSYASKHWHYQDTLGGANLEGAWDITTGSDSDIIAVIDTGILPHIELLSKTLQGYDFISDVATANDDDGRDDNATDLGDWCHEGDDCYESDYDYSDSSWHGTHVAGTIAAQSDNAQGMTGINWEGKILPVRVLGKGGGYVSDIADGMLWAAGIHVDGVPDNLYPAKVLNLSLGGGGSCSSLYLDAIERINTVGSVIVVAAGNSGIDALNSNPANCPGVITVAASSEDGSRADYSNYGALIDVTAPGGDSGKGADKNASIYSTLDGGLTMPNYDNAYASYQGTSMATPHVAGIASLITNLAHDADYEIVKCVLQKTVRPFPRGTDNDCRTDICGAGIVDATSALTLASNPDLLLERYGDEVYDVDKNILYDFDLEEDKIDSSSLWFINQGRLTSNDINDSESTSYQIDLSNVALYDISFDWKVSSENGYDFLRFYGGDANFILSGERTGFFQASAVVTVNEQVALEWDYSKDGSLSDNNDSAWIDNVAITTYKSASSLSFSKNSVKKIVVIRNVGGCEALSVGVPTLSDSVNFTLANSCSQPLRLSDSCSMVIEYVGSFDTSDVTTLSYETSDSSTPRVEKVFDVKNFSAIAPIINYLLF